MFAMSDATMSTVRSFMYFHLEEFIMVAIAIVLYLAVHTRRLPGRKGKPKAALAKTGAASKLKASTDEAEFNSGANTQQPQQKAEIAAQQSPSQKQQAAEALQKLEERMNSLLAANEFTQAYGLLRSTLRDTRHGQRARFGEDLLKNFYLGAIRVGQVSTADAMARVVRFHSANRPSEDFWTTVLKMLNARKMFATCVVVFDVCGDVLPPSRVIYSCILNAAISAPSPDRVMCIVRKFKEVVALNLSDQVTILRACQVAVDAAEADAFVRSLQDGRALHLNLALQTCGDAGESDRTVSLLRWALEREKQGLSSGLVDNISYNTALKVLAKTGDISATVDLLAEMQDAGVLPSAKALAMTAACTTSSATGARDAVRLARLIVDSEWLESSISIVADLIRFLVQEHREVPAYEIYKSVERKDLWQRDISCIPGLIKAFAARAGGIQHALEISRNIGDLGIEQESRIICFLIDGCRHQGDCEMGAKLFADYVSSGKKPSLYTLMSLLKLYCAAGAVRAGFDVLQNCQDRYGIMPSVYLFTVVACGCLRKADHQLAWETVELMNRIGVAPDEKLVELVVQGFASAGMWARVEAVLEKWFSSRGSTAAKPWPLLSASFCEDVLSRLRAANDDAAEVQRSERMLLEACGKRGRA